MVFCEANSFLELASTIMTNGICCNHSIEEDNRRLKEKALKDHIKVEWQRQFILERQHHDQLLREQGLDAATLLAAERRRILMATKRQASQHASRKNSDTTVEQMLGRKVLPSTYCPTEGLLQRSNTFNKRSYDESLKNPMHDLPICRARGTQSAGAGRSLTQVPLLVNIASPLDMSGHASNISSLLDDDSDDEDDDDFEFINLQ